MYTVTTVSPSVFDRHRNCLMFLAWIMGNSGVTFLIHYLDDYLTMGPPNSEQNMDTFISLCADLGVPLALDKLEGPSTSLLFLGITLDTEHMEIRLPDDKLTRIQQLLTTWFPKKKARKRQILSLVGTLQHATKVVRSGRMFVARMLLSLARCISRPD